MPTKKTLPAPALPPGLPFAPEPVPSELRARLERLRAESGPRPEIPMPPLRKR